MKISRSLKLVISVESDSGAMMHVHSTPVSREVFEQFFMPLSKAFSAIFSEGLGAIAGPRIAFLMLKKVSEDMGVWTALQQGFINEVIRLSNVAIPGPNGWEQMPLHVAYQREIIGKEDRNDIEGEIIFFTLVSLINKPSQIQPVMETVNGLWGSALTALDFTAYLSSLPTLNVPANTGETENTLSVPV